MLPCSQAKEINYVLLCCMYLNTITSTITCMVNLRHFTLHHHYGSLVNNNCFTLSFVSFAKCYKDKGALLNNRGKCNNEEVFRLNFSSGLCFEGSNGNKIYLNSKTKLNVVKFESHTWNEKIYNHVHNISRLFDGWANFLSPEVKRSVIISNKLAYTSCLTSCRTT